MVIAPGANLPGQSIEAMTLEFVAAMAKSIGKPITVTTGTNHNKMSASGKVSDHFSGHACDIGMFANGGTDDSPVGDEDHQGSCVSRAILEVGRAPRRRAVASSPSTTTTSGSSGIWKTNERR